MSKTGDVAYEVQDGLAWITIDREERYNAFRGQTIDELIDAFKRAWADENVGVAAFNEKRVLDFTPYRKAVSV